MPVFTRGTSPDVTHPTPAPYSAHRGLTAAATRINLKDKSQLEQHQRRRQASGWQDDAWEYYDLIGEIKYAFRLFSSVLSRVRLYAAVIVDEDSPPVPIKEADLEDVVKNAAKKAMRRAFGPTNQADILRKASINILVAGECYLVKLPAKFGVRDTEQWKILSVDELVTRGDENFYKKNKEERVNDHERLNDNFVGRIWNEHARYSDDADSSMRALIDLCDDLFLYTRAARASARSRLNAGLLFVPDTLSVSAEQNTDYPDDIPLDPDMVPEASDPEDDLFEQELIDGMTTPIADESSAASIVPLLVRGPREDGEKIKHIKFERQFDPQIAQRAERSLERILQGIDLPKDIVTGLANIKYSNAIQIEESLYTAHVEPLVLLLCDAFRSVYLVPALEAAGIDPEVIDDLVIWYDPSAIMTAPDKSNAANLGFDKFALSFAAWRRANGFAESDAPDGEEIAQRIAIARGQLNDSITEELFRTIMPDVLDQARANALSNSPTGPLSPELTEALNPGAVPPPDDPTSGGAPTERDPALPPVIKSGDSSGSTPPPVPGS